MHAELQVLSPLVPVRKVQFLRFCKQLADGAWAVVDVSIDGATDNCPGDSMGCRRLPSGCVVQEMPNGYSKVTFLLSTLSSFPENSFLFYFINSMCQGSPCLFLLQVKA